MNKTINPELVLAEDCCCICGKKNCRGHNPGNGDPSDGSGRMTGLPLYLEDKQ